MENFYQYYMESNNNDYLSQLPEEILDLIFYHCSKNNYNNYNHSFIRYEYYCDYKVYQEYCGDMENGCPHGNGIMYRGRYFYTEARNEYLKNGLKTPWIFLPLFYVYPKFQPKLTVLTY